MDKPHKLYLVLRVVYTQLPITISTIQTIRMQHLIITTIHTENYHSIDDSHRRLLHVKPATGVISSTGGSSTYNRLRSYVFNTSQQSRDDTSTTQVP